MLLRPATRNYGRNIGPLFKITATKFQNVKFRALPRSGSGNGLLPLFITLVAGVNIRGRLPDGAANQDSLCRLQVAPLLAA
jgi:hypothetical protein